MTDRAQFTTPRLVPGLFVAVAVLAVVAAELRDHVGAVDGPVDYCGLCHINWELTFTAAVIFLLWMVAALVVSTGVGPRNFGGKRDE